MTLETGDVEAIAHLARVAVEEDKLPEYARNLDNVLQLAEQMNAVSTDKVEPIAHPMNAVQRLREDSVTESDQHEKFQTVAPATEDSLYLVPKVIE